MVLDADELGPIHQADVVLLDRRFFINRCNQPRVKPFYHLDYLRDLGFGVGVDATCGGATLTTVFCWM